MRFSTFLLVLSCTISLPACLGAEGVDAALIDPSIDADCGCVFPGTNPDAPVAALCGEDVCFEEQVYSCTSDAQALAVGTCAGAADGETNPSEFAFSDTAFTNGAELPSSCQGVAGECSGDTALSCEDKAGCIFLPSGACVGTPAPCSARIDSVCTQFGGACFLVTPLSEATDL